VTRRAVALTFVSLLIVASDGWGQPRVVTPSPTPSASTRSTLPPPNGAVGTTYEAKGRRDPFQAVETTQSEPTPPALAAARLKGILRSSAPRALIETPDGLGYILKVGDTLAEGRLIEISADRVVFSVETRRGPAHRIVLRLSDN
jgi:Tfp pilus assembly protein PilP